MFLSCPHYKLVRFVVDVLSVQCTVRPAVETVRLAASCDVYGIYESVFYKGISKSVQSFGIEGFDEIQISFEVSGVCTACYLAFEDILFFASRTSCLNIEP